MLDSYYNRGLKNWLFFSIFCPTFDILLTKLLWLGTTYEPRIVFFKLDHMSNEEVGDLGSLAPRTLHLAVASEASSRHLGTSFKFNSPPPKSPVYFAEGGRGGHGRRGQGRSMSQAGPGTKRRSITREATWEASGMGRDSCRSETPGL